MRWQHASKESTPHPGKVSNLRFQPSKVGPLRSDMMEQQLARAIQEEDYEKAAKLRDEIAQMKGKQN